MLLFNFLFYSVLCLTFVILYSNRRRNSVNTILVLLAIITIIWLGISLGLRDIRGDRFRYYSTFFEIANLNFLELFNSFTSIPMGFKFLNWLISLISTNSFVFLFSMYIFCVVPLYLGFRSSSNRIESLTLTMLYILFPFYLVYLGSGLKQGIGFGFMLWGFNLIMREKDNSMLKGFLILFISISFHYSYFIALFVILAWLFFFKKTSLMWSYIIFMLSIALSFLNISENLMRLVLPLDLITYLGFQEYLDGTLEAGHNFLLLNYKSGFRFDFALFIIFPCLVSSFLKKIYGDIYTNKSIELMKIYLLFSSIYFLLNFIPFSDRLASFTFFLLPYLFYQLFNTQKLDNIKTFFVMFTMFSYPVLLVTYMRGYFL